MIVFCIVLYKETVNLGLDNSYSMSALTTYEDIGDISIFEDTKLVPMLELKVLSGKYN